MPPVGSNPRWDPFEGKLDDSLNLPLTCMFPPPPAVIVRNIGTYSARGVYWDADLDGRTISA